MGGDPLRDVWDFDDLDATERRFEALAEAETSPVVHAEILTQLARVQGLRGAFEAGDRLVDEAAAVEGSSALLDARVALERGRLRRSSGDLATSRPLFESAYSTAREAGEWFVAADAAHMAALAAHDREGMLEWTRRGIELAEAEEGARYWLGPLLNNLGWAHYEAEEYDEALAAFSRALEARERDGDEVTVGIAQYAVGKALRALDRPAEAVPLLEQAARSAAHRDQPDGWFHEELAEDYAALGRDDEAREQAERALPLLTDADASFPGSEREERLRSLARRS
jgi:tetratricopeptide (TPR) repeat protein